MGAAPPVSFALRERAERMAARVGDVVRRTGIAPADAAAVDRAFRTAMRPRDERLEDDHHPAYLHPGRTVLILLGDAGVADPAVLAAGALAETLDLGLAAAEPVLGAAAEPRTRELLELVPIPARDGDALTELLVIAPEPVCLVALAEMLDHARHLHLRPELDAATLYHQTRTVYLPVAERTNIALARRFRSWCDAFGRRLR